METAPHIEAPAMAPTGNLPAVSALSGDPRTSANAIAIGGAADGARGIALNPQSLGEVVRFAEVMSRSDCAIRKHLRGNPGACMAVTLQALRWGMDPFAVASKSYLVSDAIAYEAQLISAVINTRSSLKRRPAITYSGEGAKRACKVVGEFADGSVCVYESPTFDTITPKNSPLWKSDPDQQLSYYSVRAFARRFCPEVILGVYDADELEGAVTMTAEPRKRGDAAEVTPQKLALADAIRSRSVAQEAAA